MVRASPADAPLNDAIDSSGGSSRNMAVIVSAAVTRWNARRPETSSYSTSAPRSRLLAQRKRAAGFGIGVQVIAQLTVVQNFRLFQPALSSSMRPPSHFVW